MVKLRLSYDLRIHITRKVLGHSVAEKHSVWERGGRQPLGAEAGMSGGALNSGMRKRVGRQLCNHHTWS